VFKQLGLTGALALTRPWRRSSTAGRTRSAPRSARTSRARRRRRASSGSTSRSRFRAPVPGEEAPQSQLPPGRLPQRQGAFAEIFETGGGVSPRHAKYLAIALPAARKLGFDYGYAESGHGLRFTKRSMVEAAERQLGPFRPIRAKGGNKILAVTTAGGLGRRLRRQGPLRPRQGHRAKARGKKRDFVPLFVLVKRRSTRRNSTSSYRPRNGSTNAARHRHAASPAS
jgi:hypothetical protein